MTAPINSDEDHESDHKINYYFYIMATVMTMIFEVKKGVM